MYDKHWKNEYDNKKKLSAVYINAFYLFLSKVIIIWPTIIFKHNAHLSGPKQTT